MRDGNGFGFTAGFFLGATMGAMAALLFAPKTGRELRGGISRESERLRERAYGVASDLRERGEAAFRTTQKAAEDTAARFGERDPAEDITASRPTPTSG